MEIIVTSGEILSFMLISGMFLIGVAIGYFIGRYDGRKGL
jgi:ABC-type cobalt transport system substrate-binding protein